MAGYVALPGYDYPRNALDVSPLNDAITGYRKAGYDNALMNLKERADTRETESHDWERQKFQTVLADRKKKAIGATAQALLNMPPEQRPKALAALRVADKNFDPEMRSAGYDPDDVDTWGPLAVAQARGVQDPYGDQKTLAEINKTNAQADYYRGGGRSAAAGSSADERIVERLMTENPYLSYPEALELARSRPRDRISRESLALRASKDQGSSFYDQSDLDANRDRYGVGPNSLSPYRSTKRPPASLGTAPANRFDFSGQMRQSQPSDRARAAIDVLRRRAAAGDSANILREAREAIAKGIDPGQVRQRLKDAGIDASGF